MSSLSCFSPFTSLWGTFNIQSCSCWGTERQSSTWKHWQISEKMFLGIVGKSFWSARLKDSQPRFHLLLYILLLTSEGMEEIERFCDVEDPAQMLHASLTLRHFVFMLLMCCLYVLWPRSVIENIWLNPSGWFVILNFIRTSTLGQNPWLTLGTTKRYQWFMLAVVRNMIGLKLREILMSTVHKFLWSHSYDHSYLIEICYYSPITYTYQVT